MGSVQGWAEVILIGVGATMVMDVWGFIQRRLGISTLDYAMVGRWVGHLFKGRFSHAHIGKASPVAGERLLGWVVHYATGIAFAVLLIGVFGMSWLETPTWWPALAVGVCTVAIPFFVTQPAMGMGVAASRTPVPWVSRLRSVLTHAVFGGGLYLSAAMLRWTAIH